MLSCSFCVLGVFKVLRSAVSFTITVKSLYLYQPGSLTWMSSSLELNSVTNTFSPSLTRVRDTHSLPLTSVCASSGRSLCRPERSTLIRLNVGCRGPRLRFRASLATSITFPQHFSATWRHTLINYPRGLTTHRYKLHASINYPQEQTTKK